MLCFAGDFSAGEYFLIVTGDYVAKGDVSVVLECAGAGTCVGNCGGAFDSNGVFCLCDPICEGFGVCCPDFHDECSATTAPPSSNGGTCVGHCGGTGDYDPSGPACNCDQFCELAGDCCVDFNDVCSNVTTPPITSEAPSTTNTLPPTVPVSTPMNSGTNTCVDHCGGIGDYDPSDPVCWCDLSCVEAGDCCPDFQDACLSVTIGPS